jgi:hypothetical protein
MTSLDPLGILLGQANYTGIVNMNTADALGDAFFKFRTVLSINECLFPTPNGCVANTVQTRVFFARANIVI